MRIFDFPFAPNPRKLRVYLGEKGLAIPFVTVHLGRGEQHAPEFLARNPLGSLPVLELDDGTCLSESLAIIEYLEELHPEPPLIGREPFERARVRRLERIADGGVLQRLGRIVHNTRSPLPGVRGVPAVAEAARAELPRALAVLDAELEGRPFVAGAQPTIADCTLFAALEFARLFGVAIDPRFANLARWHAAFGERRSARID
jgi:glutathione S-transferase